MTLNSEIQPTENRMNRLEVIQNRLTELGVKALGKAVLTLGLASGLVVVSGAVEVATESERPAYAASLEETVKAYPWHDAVHLTPEPDGPAKDNITWGYNPKQVCDDKSTKYDCKTKNVGGYNVYDPWGQYVRNCTSLAAWVVAEQYGIDTSQWGDGENWNDKAKALKYEVDNEPEVGDIAVWEATTSNPFGHVALVLEVRTKTDGSKEVRLGEANQRYTGLVTTDRWAKAGSYVDLNGHPEGGGTTPPVKYDDFMIYRPTGGGTWFAKAGQNGVNQINSAWGVMHGGWNGDKPFVGDFNGDGYDDYGIYRMEGGAGTWYVKSSADGGHTAIWGAVHGSPGDIPVVGDMDGDNFADFGIYRVDSNGTGRWYFKSGRTGQPTPVWGWDHGNSSDIPVVGDMNGDNIDDYGIYRVDAANQTGYWYFKSSADGRTTPVWGWTAGGWPGDVPVVGKFTTDNVDDFGIYRMNPTNSTGYWYMKSGGNGQPIPEAWNVAHGSPGDVPLVGEFN